MSLHIARFDKTGSHLRLSLQLPFISDKFTTVIEEMALSELRRLDLILKNLYEH